MGTAAFATIGIGIAVTAGFNGYHLTEGERKSPLVWRVGGLVLGLSTSALGVIFLAADDSDKEV